MAVIGKGSYVNKVEERFCPCCGRMRPLDWFDAKTLLCWKCKPRTPDEWMAYYLTAMGLCSAEDELIGSPQGADAEADGRKA